jgi:hypothetical protein
MDEFYEWEHTDHSYQLHRFGAPGCFALPAGVSGVSGVSGVPATSYQLPTTHYYQLATTSFFLLFCFYIAFDLCDMTNIMICQPGTQI